ncbi:MAG: HAD-IB family hydrolase [Solirubrobacteraceae bacterium]|nr:HAD-IB family hydrolase [Solirubrobacteraceae bacterium]
MATTAELVARIRAAPAGPSTVACFDYDGTVISGFSASRFYAHRLRNWQIGPVELAKTLALVRRGIRTAEDFDDLLALSLGAWTGAFEEDLQQLGRRLFRSEIAERLHPEVWPLIAAHHERGHAVVLATSATRFQIEPAARELDVDTIICTEVEVDGDGRLTGRALGTPPWGAGKARALLDLLDERGADPADAFAYSNGDEDVPLLESVGHPAAVEPEPGLRERAIDEGWPVLRCERRDDRPGLRDRARTGTLYGAVATGLVAGVGIGALRRSRSTALDIATGVGSDVALALTGIDVRVVSGREHLWSARPCVFVFNHQSGIDVPVLMHLLRGGFTGVAKKEVRSNPVFGPLLRLGDVAFIDRSDAKKAIEVMAPAVQKVRDEGVSLAISPEGTRSVSPRLGPFKKGAFHIAMQAEVPMVPIVLRNAGEVMWGNSQRIRPGTIDVAVLPPIDTSGWTRETIDEHVADVRGRFVDTLTHWPEPAPRTLTERTS